MHKRVTLSSYFRASNVVAVAIGRVIALSCTTAAMPEIAPGPHLELVEPKLINQLVLADMRQQSDSGHAAETQTLQLLLGQVQVALQERGQRIHVCRQLHAAVHQQSKSPNVDIKVLTKVATTHHSHS